MLLLEITLVPIVTLKNGLLPLLSLAQIVSPIVTLVLMEPLVILALQDIIKMEPHAQHAVGELIQHLAQPLVLLVLMANGLYQPLVPAQVVELDVAFAQQPALATLVMLVMLKMEGILVINVRQVLMQLQDLQAVLHAPVGHIHLLERRLLLIVQLVELVVKLVQD